MNSTDDQPTLMNQEAIPDAAPTGGWRSPTFHADFVRGSKPELKSEVQSLLHVRLRAAGLVLTLGLVVFYLRHLLIGEVLPLRGASLIVMLLTGGITTLLFLKEHLGLRTLRVLELLLVGPVTLVATARSYIAIQHYLAAGSEDLALLEAQSSLLTYPVLILIYVLFIPNTWKRAAQVIVPIAMAPMAIRILLYFQVPEFQEIVRPEHAGIPLLAMLLTGGAAIYGTHVINSLRVEAFQARQLGQYQLVEKIGSGGMGEVWKAEHQMLARPAAVKLIRPDMLGTQSPATAETMLKRFEREAQATAKLTSPNSVVIYDFGITDDGTFYYVMELLDGLDLESLVERFGPVTPARTIHLLIQACESLADAHHQGLIHRDIKPANIYACRMGRTYDFAKLLDFGLVKTYEDQEQATAQLTQAGMVTGTPAFLPPEQALGETVDARSDLYALACVGYWLLTAGFVFDTQNAAAMMIDHVKTVPESPSVRAEQEIPADLDKVIMRCLEKRADDRPSSAEELADALRACKDYGTWNRDEAKAWWTVHMGAR